jgi:hypothetical protein
MKSYRKELNFHTKTRRAYVNITPQVEAALAESGIHEGLCLVNAMNITAWWWLRTPGMHSNTAVYVNTGGSINLAGHRAYNGDGGVRPAIWVKL